MPNEEPFAPGAALIPIAGQLRGARESAASGRLHLDPEAARTLLAALEQARTRAHQMISEAKDLSTPMRFGDNWIGRLLDDRLRGAAHGGPSSAVPVLEEFNSALEELESTVRAAAGRYTATDDEAQEHLARAYQGDKA